MANASDRLKKTGKKTDAKGKEDSEESAVELSAYEEHEVEEKVPTRSPVIFEIVRRMGEEELNRPISALWWSGIAAGLAMGFSVLTEAVLKSQLGVFTGSVLIQKMGYTVGFLLVILARQQLFTESTLTSVVPLLAHFHLKNAQKLVRLWTVVFLANLVGTALFACFLAFAPVIDGEVLNQAIGLGMESIQHSPFELLARGIGAGFLIATLVWILANVETGKFFAIVAITYVIAISKFAHIIAGSVEGALVIVTGHLPVTTVLFGFTLPTLVGNILGGTGLFALITYGQLREEIK